MFATFHVAYGITYMFSILSGMLKANSGRDISSLPVVWWNTASQHLTESQSCRVFFLLDSNYCIQIWLKKSTWINLIEKKTTMYPHVILNYQCRIRRHHVNINKQNSQPDCGPLCRALLRQYSPPSGTAVCRPTPLQKAVFLGCTWVVEG